MLTADAAVVDSVVAAVVALIDTPYLFFVYQLVALVYAVDETDRQVLDWRFTALHF